MNILKGKRIGRVVVLAALAAAGCAAPEAQITSAEDALTTLRKGNVRFAEGTARHPHADAPRRKDTALHGQHPFAVIVGCSDSRVPVEIIFDQGLGDLFVVRVAGNVIATDETGSVEYAVEHLQTPLVIILGHTDCGAVTAAVKGGHEHGSIPRLVEHILPAVDEVRGRHPDRVGAELVRLAVEQNVLHSMEDLIVHSEVVREALERGTLCVVGGVYDVETAQVRWLGPHPDQLQLLQGPTKPFTE